MEVRDDGRAGDAREAPGRQDAAVDGAELARAEDIGEIGRHAREATAVAADDQQHEQLKDEGFSRLAELPEREDLEQEEEHVDAAAADVVGDRRPDDAPAAVEDADDADHRRRR